MYILESEVEVSQLEVDLANDFRAVDILAMAVWKLLMWDNMLSKGGQFVAKLKIVLAIALSMDTHVHDCLVKSSYFCEK